MANDGGPTMNDGAMAPKDSEGKEPNSQGQAAELETKACGLYTGLFAAIKVLEDLRDLNGVQADENRKKLNNVLETLNGLSDLALCVSRLGETDDTFKKLSASWRKTFYAKRKKTFKNADLLAAHLGLTEETVRALESGHRIPTRHTMEILLASKELNLDKYDLFVQVILNRFNR